MDVVRAPALQLYSKGHCNGERLWLLAQLTPSQHNSRICCKLPVSKYSPPTNAIFGLVYCGCIHPWIPRSMKILLGTLHPLQSLDHMAICAWARTTCKGAGTDKLGARCLPTESQQAASNWKMALLYALPETQWSCSINTQITVIYCAEWYLSDSDALCTFAAHSIVHN